MNDHDLDQFDEPEDGLPNPTWRATIRGRRLTLTEWTPWLIRGGPLAMLLPEREQAAVTIADLTLHGEQARELSVRFYALGTGKAAAEDVLLDWATRVGYHRVWLPDRLLTIEPQSERVETAVVRCPVCLARWQDATPEFWLTVAKAGLFPKWCPVCGCELPQWSVRRRRSRSDASRAERGESWRGSGSRPQSRQEKA